MEIGDITAVTQYAVLILFYIMMAQMVMVMMSRALICLERIKAVLEFEPSIQDGQTHEVNDIQSTNEIIQFDNTSFRFDGADENTLDRLSFSVNRGETTAIIGSTGSGKSTIARLILRFFDVTSGSIRLNAMDIRELSQHDLRAMVSYVPQKAWLFSGTIRSNLMDGDEQATDAQLKEALAAAQADFVHQLDKGMDAPVAQGGTNFSGGQRQRLSIARALTKQADLYVFDDGFSALDSKTDAALRQALSQKVKDAGVLIIAQKVSTIINADQIIVLEEGQIVGKGTHDELMKTCDVYQDIAKSQMKGGSINE